MISIDTLKNKLREYFITGIKQPEQPTAPPPSKKESGKVRFSVHLKNGTVYSVEMKYSSLEERTSLSKELETTYLLDLNTQLKDSNVTFILIPGVATFHRDQFSSASITNS